jgi:hypothetical protein
MVNGVVLANGVDFYQSISNSKRIILTGSIILDDIITISYFPNTSVVNNVSVSTPSASWFITPSPQKVNGYFTLQLAEDIDFNINDDIEQRKFWRQLYTYRLIKIIEWFKTPEFDFEINMYENNEKYKQECLKDNSKYSDLFVTIDYFDQISFLYI